MGGFDLKIGLLTSSRADFGIYYPLAKELSNDSFFNLEIIAFGTHLSEQYGYTLKEIEKQGFEVKHKINTMPKGSTPYDISNSISYTIQEFSKFWNKNRFDLVLTLGDRFEMFAAVTAGSPFNVKFAHIHAGETTLGAIDNAYRHGISLMSEYLFVSTKDYKKRAIEINQQPGKVFNVGALSIDNLINQDFFSIDEIKTKFDIDIAKPTILSTFHSETVALENNKRYIRELIMAFKEAQTKYQLLITMPNADTMGLLIREELKKYAKGNPNVILRESLGMKGYLSCMKHCSFMLGNTSSGFVEAAFFPKWVINLGDRQKGRIRTPNMIDCRINKDAIIKTINKIESKKIPDNCNIYGNGNTAIKIEKIIKKIFI